MNNNNKPSNTDLPSSAKLIKSTAVAIALAALILVTAVLPAEYGIDPTGVGNVLGLTKMGEIKVSLAQEAAAEMVTATAKIMKTETQEVAKPVAKASENIVEAQVQESVKSDSITLSLKPDQGREVKVTMLKGGKVNYHWKTSNGRANFDVHGDSKQHRIDYFNYSKGSTVSDAGVLEAAFDGNHGWFWRNRTGETMTITLEVEGEFTEMTEAV
jgi:hypothetical protein